MELEAGMAVGLKKAKLKMNETNLYLVHFTNQNTGNICAYCKPGCAGYSYSTREKKNKLSRLLRTRKIWKFWSYSLLLTSSFSNDGTETQKEHHLLST